MRILSLIIVVSCLTIISNAQENARWKFYRVESPSLKNNLVDENIYREIGVYLPPSYFESNKRYPVIYYLHGFNSGNLDPHRNLRNTRFDELEKKVTSGKIAEVIMVYVEATNRFRGSFYINSPVTGNWNDYLTKDIVNHVDSEYRTLATKESRSIVGGSMGGYGALNISMMNPDIFCAGFGISPGVYIDNGFASSQIILGEGNIETTMKLFEWLGSMPKEKAHNNYMQFLDTCTNRTLIFTMAYGAAHAPNTSKAPYFNFPIKVVGKDTIVDQEVWQLWQNGFGGLDWKTERYKNNLQQLKVYGISCGYNDGYRWIYEGCLYLSEKLTENRINHILDLHHGTHGSNNNFILLNHVLPLFSNAMEN